MPGFAALSVAGPGEGEWRVAPDCRHPKPPQTVQAQAITPAGAGGSNGMRTGSRLGSDPRAEPSPHPAVVQLRCDLMSAVSLSALLANDH